MDLAGLLHRPEVKAVALARLPAPTSGIFCGAGRPAAAWPGTALAGPCPSGLQPRARGPAPSPFQEVSSELGPDRDLARGRLWQWHPGPACVLMWGLGIFQDPGLWKPLLLL